MNWEKRRNLPRVAGQFLCARHIEKATCRFDVPAISLLELSFPTFPPDAVDSWRFERLLDEAKSELSRKRSRLRSWRL